MNIFFYFLIFCFFFTFMLYIIQSMKFSRPEYWSGQPFPSPGDLPNPGIEAGSPTLQADPLPSEPPRQSLHLTTQFSHALYHIPIIVIFFPIPSLEYS